MGWVPPRGLFAGERSRGRAGGGREGEQGAQSWGSTFPIRPQAQEIPGVKIFRSSSTLYFANVEMYAEALKKKVVAPPAPAAPRLSALGG